MISIYTLMQLYIKGYQSNRHNSSIDNMIDCFIPIEYYQKVDGRVILDDDYDLKVAIMISIHIGSHRERIGDQNVGLLQKMVLDMITMLISNSGSSV